MIRGIGNAGMLSGMGRAGSVGAASGQVRLSKAPAGFTNADGQSLSDIRDSLKDAVQSTIRDGGSRSDVQNAVRTVLEDNGFDADEVMSSLSTMRGQGQGFAGAMQRVPAGTLFDRTA